MEADLYNAPRYATGEVARLLRMKTSRVRAWLQGRPGAMPVIGMRDLPSGEASFTDLVELRLIHELLEHYSLQKIRLFHRQLSEQFDTVYPFSTRRLYVDGSTLVAEFELGVKSHMVDAGASGQLVLPEVIRHVGREIRFDESRAMEWLPLEKDTIIVNPRRSFGAPIVASGVKTSNVYDLYLGEGRSIEKVCRWFGITEAEVSDAVRFEESLLLGKAA